jgi:molybdopterin-guanine dinucleotide biosynthesis protein B
VLAPFFTADYSHYKVSEKAKKKKTKENSSCMAKTRVFAISGYSGSGKTTLLSKIIAVLYKKGKTVAVIKNSKEDILAPNGTDTRQHQDAGADPVILLGPKTSTFRYRERKNLLEILKNIETDFLLLEGFKKLAIPKFWCVSKNEEIHDSATSNVIKAIVGWEAIRLGQIRTEVPFLIQSEVDKLISIIDDYAITIDDAIALI